MYGNDGAAQTGQRKREKTQDKDTKFGPYIINQIGRRYERMQVISKKDCIKVYCKGWVEKQTW